MNLSYDKAAESAGDTKSTASEPSVKENMYFSGCQFGKKFETFVNETTMFIENFILKNFLLQL